MNNWKLRHSFTGNATSDVQTVNGYLADPAYHLTTNLLLQSNQFDTTWTTNTASVTSGQSGYDGNTDAWSLSVGTSFFSGIYQSLSLNGVSTASIYAKAGTFSFLGIINLSGAGFAGWFDLINGTVGNLDASVIDASMEAVGNGWWRCSFSQDRSGTSYFQLRPSDTNSAPSSTSGNIYIQDAQLEEGTQATTYVETTTDPVTLPDTFNVTVVPDGKEYAAPLFIPRTNLMEYSEDFSAWTSTNTTVNLDQAVSPEGVSNAAEIVPTAVSGEHYIQYGGFNRTAGQYFTHSVYAKANGYQYLYLNNGASRLYAVFDIVNGTVKYLGSNISEFINISATVQDVGDGWFRCTFSGEALSTAASYVRLGCAPTAINSYSISFLGDGTSGAFIYGMQVEVGDTTTAYIPTNGSAVTRDWSAFGRVQNQLPGICNGTHTHTGAASGSGIAATTITGSGSGATFAYDFDTLGVLTTLTADGAGSGYKVGDKLSIDTTEGHTIEFRLVEGSNAATVSVSMGAAKPNKPVPFPVSKMRVEGLTDRTVLFMDERSRYVFPKPTPYLLDTYEGAAAAYSLRRLRSSYTGPAVRVRRETNNDELDIYFNRDGSLDTATLEAFCAGTDGFVKVWYDQGQGGNDAAQTTTASQPKIVSSGSIVTENGLPAVQFTRTSSQYLQNTSDIMTGPDLCLISVFKGTSASIESRHIIDQSGTNYGGALAISSGNKLTAAARFTGAFVGLVSSIDSTTQQLLFANWASGDSYLAIDGTVAASSSTTFSGSGSPGLPFLIGGDSTTSLRYVDGNLQEVIVYNTDQSTNRQGIEDNINDHYGIYP